MTPLKQLTELIGKDAEFFAPYLENGNSLTVHQKDGLTIVIDKNGHTAWQSFEATDTKIIKHILAYGTETIIN